MNTTTVKDQAIFAEMKSCLQELGFRVSKEFVEKGSLTLRSKCIYQNIGIPIEVIYYTNISMIDIVAHCGIFPRHKMNPLYVLLNEINADLIANHFSVNPENCEVALRGGIHVSDVLDKYAFKESMQQIAAVLNQYYTLIIDLNSFDVKPEDIMRAFREKRAANREEIIKHFQSDD